MMDTPDPLARLLADWTDLTARKEALDAQLRVCAVCGARPPLEWCPEHVPNIVAMEEECDGYSREHFPALVEMIEVVQTMSQREEVGDTSRSPFGNAALLREVLLRFNAIATKVMGEEAGDV